MTAIKLLIISIITSFHFAHAAGDDNAIIQKYIPESWIIDPTGNRQPVENENFYLGEIHQWADLDGTGTKNYLVVAYRSYGVDGEEDFNCTLRVIKSDNKKQTLMENTITQFPEEITGCTELIFKSLDSSKKPELIVNSILGKEDASPAIFKWDGNKLISVTPTSNYNGKIYNAFKKVIFGNELVDGKILIVSISSMPDAPKKIYTYNNGQIVLKDTHELLAFVDNSTKQPTIISKTIPSGDYILEVKNLSTHKRTVRAEITVNDVVVLKPKDFCKNPNSAIKWAKLKNEHDDDDDDINEDQCKRCDPKIGIYAPVTVSGPLEIKVKLFGTRNSKIQLTMDKK